MVLASLGSGWAAPWRGSSSRLLEVEPGLAAPAPVRVVMGRNETRRWKELEARLAAGQHVAPTFTGPSVGVCPALSTEPTFPCGFSLKFSFWFSVLMSPPPAARAGNSNICWLQSWGCSEHIKLIQACPGPPSPSPVSPQVPLEARETMPMPQPFTNSGPGSNLIPAKTGTWRPPSVQTKPRWNQT